MNKEEAKQWAELFTALAEGKTIERQMIAAATDSYCWVQVDSISTIVELKNYRIKPTPKTRRMTNQELADWIRDEPQEHREWKHAGSGMVYVVCKYTEDDTNKEVSYDILIRRNHGEWEEPIIEVEE